MDDKCTKLVEVVAYMYVDISSALYFFLKVACRRYGSPSSAACAQQANIVQRTSARGHVQVYCKTASRSV